MFSRQSNLQRLGIGWKDLQNIRPLAAFSMPKASDGATSMNRLRPESNAQGHGRSPRRAGAFRVRFGPRLAQLLCTAKNPVDQLRLAILLGRGIGSRRNLHLLQFLEDGF